MTTRPMAAWRFIHQNGEPHAFEVLFCGSR